MQGFFLLRGFLAPLLFLLAPVSAALSDEPAERLIKAADSLRLHENSQWLKLLHYHRHGMRLASDIDGGYFFLSPRGKTDSRAEMAATLRALFSREDLSLPMEKGMEEAAMHPLCKFPARRRFLGEHLAFPDSLLPDVDCGRFRKWKAALNPSGATLIFASSYLNNPASTFGHTFLRLNTYSGEGERAILNYGVSYGAAVPPGEGFAFVYKGISGMYRASYSIAPYYLSLQKYSHLESRDIWEYDLALDSIRLEQLLEHTWELGACWMDYYFFDENCSYNIITLLDAVSPGLNLADSLDGAVVIPTETVKLLTRKKGLVKDVRWRPSLLTGFRVRAAGMGDPERGFLRGLIFGDASVDYSRTGPFSRDTVSALMDAALDYIQYQKRRSEGRSSALWNQRQRRLLLARASLPPAPSLYPVMPDRAVTSPEAGHDSHRLETALGMSDYRYFSEFGFRLAYHDFNADEAGYLSGSQIENLRLRLRIYCGVNCDGSAPEFGVQSLDVINILSITPMDFIRQPLSWGFRLAFERRPDRAHQPGGALLAEGGAGVAAARAGYVDIKAYLLAQARLRARLRDEGRPGFGPQLKLGGRLGLGRAASLWMEHRRFFPVVGGEKPESDLYLEYRQSLVRNADLRLSLAGLDEVGEAALTCNVYF